MNRVVVRIILGVWLLIECAVAPAHARGLPNLSYEEYVAKSDLVAIIEPIENKPAKDVYSEHMYGHSAEDFQATNTRFKVLAVLKGAGTPTKELTVLHFSYSERVKAIYNGARFIRFLIGPIGYEKRALKDKTPVGGVKAYEEEPTWLAFLKRREDGRYEPVTDHYDSAFSFRELHSSSFFVP